MECLLSFVNFAIFQSATHTHSHFSLLQLLTGIAGAHKLGELEALREKYEGCLYLCCDMGEDTGVEGGSFEDIKEIWKMSRSEHVKVSPKDIAFRVAGATSDDEDINESWLAAVRKYAGASARLTSCLVPPWSCAGHPRELALSTQFTQL